MNLHREVFAICEAFGVDPDVVREITLTPTSAEVEVFLRNDEGRKFIRADGFVATERFRVPITTAKAGA